MKHGLIFMLMMILMIFAGSLAFGDQTITLEISFDLNDLTWESIHGYDRPRLADCDIIPHPQALANGIRFLDDGHDFVQLYNGVLVNLTDDFLSAHPQWDDLVDNLKSFPPDSVDPLHADESADQFPLFGNADYRATGGCTACRRTSFFNAGGWNENFVSYGFEDMEFHIRVQKLGYRFDTLEDYNAYHFDHPRGPDSQPDTARRFLQWPWPRQRADESVQGVLAVR